MVTAESNKIALSAVALVLVCLALFANTLPNDFIWDDKALIPGNMYIQSPEKISLVFTPRYWNDLHPISPSGQYRPLRAISFIMDFYFWGLAPFGFHLTNLLLHTTNVVLIYFFVLMLLNQDRLDIHKVSFRQNRFFSIPLLTALFFAIHPIHTESINFIKNRSDLLALLFVLIALILFMQYSSQKRFRTRMFLYAGALISFCLALLAKEAALVLPAIIIVYVLCFIPGQNRLKKIISAMPFFALAGLYYVFHQTALRSESMLEMNAGLGTRQHFLAVAQTLGCYLKLLVFPINLNADRIFSIPESMWTPVIITALTMMATCTILAVLLYHKNKTAFFGLCWIFLTLIPATNIIYLGTRPLAEQRLYIPSLGFCLLLGMGINILFFAKTTTLNKLKDRIVVGMTIFILIFFSLTTIRRNVDWRDDVTLFSKTVQNSPDNFRAHFNLGAALYQEQRLAEAVHQYKRALQLKPDLAEGFNNLGLALLTQGNADEAVKNFQMATQIDPSFDQAYNNLGLVRMNRGDIDQAVDDFKVALKLKPDSGEALNNLGLALMEKGLLAEAIETYRTALTINPDNAQAHENLGVCLYRMKRPNEALHHFVTAITLNPDDGDSRYNLGVVLANEHRPKEAMLQFIRAIDIDPGHMLARQGIEECKKGITGDEGNGGKEVVLSRHIGKK